MPNAKDAETVDERFLVIGGTGGGKTSLFTTIPGKKFLYIFDPNALSTIQGLDIDYEMFLTENLPLDAIALAAGKRDNYSTAGEPRSYVAWEEDFETKIEEGFFDDYDVIGFDSLTLFSDLVMDRILWLNGRSGKWPEQADWTAAINTISNVMRTLVALNKATYTTTHYDTKVNEKTGATSHVMTVIGRLRQKLPLLFSQVWLAYGDVDKDNQPRHFVQTQQDQDFPYLRSTRSIGVEFIEDVTIEDWSKPERYGIGQILARKGKK
jgi:hypothetical protein